MFCHPGAGRGPDVMLLSLDSGLRRNDVLA
jgi:hypothetical protein